ncbi:STM4015 family protein [Motilimonas sp. E26]|uniref:STM4015 family protein n=1 Tax=Motilimonas sp. E26 TaxID=2865674 RepID=UPI001E2F7E8C|nr:STM4015 family protein [Motilimonas sp. E26]MCE0557872.1 STM4015 family protein [Motilimonas sp. E26]
MTISSHIERFYDLPIEQFDADKGVQNANAAIRLEVDYDAAEDGAEMIDVLARLINGPKVNQIQALILGCWEEAYENDAGIYVDFLVEHAAALSGLKAIFIGEMTYEENEISWINQGNYSRFWAAFPALEHLQIRGAEGLELGDIAHSNLKTLIIESGGLGRDVIAAVANAKLPALETLGLWLGDESYGWDGDISTVTPLMSQQLFPKLTSLALKNSEIQNEIVAELVKSDLLGQLTDIDLSMGIMLDAGAELLIANQGLLAGKKIDVSENFLSAEVVEKLQASGLDIQVNDQKEADDDGDGDVYRYVSVAE